MDEQSKKLEVFHRVRNVKKNQTELRNNITKRKKIEEIHSRLNDTEEQISEQKE